MTSFQIEARRSACLFAAARKLFRTSIAVTGTLLALQAGAAPGVTDQDILIGQTGTQTGPLAGHNLAYIDGARLYFESINTAGGIHGRKIRLRSLDDGYDPDRALENVRTLVEREKVFALFACFGTGPSMKILPYASSGSIPFFAPYSGAQSLRSPTFPVAYHLRASYDEEIEKIVDHLSLLGITSMGIVYHDDDFGRSGLEAARRAMTSRGITPAATLPIRPDGADAASTVTALSQIHPAALLMITAGRSSSRFIRAVREANIHPQLYGLSVLSSKALIDELGDLANGMIVTQVVPSPHRLDAPVAAAYRQAAETAGHSATHAGLEGFIAAKIFAEALNRAGEDLTRAGFIAALQRMTRYDAGGFAISYGHDRHAGSHYVDLSMVNRGRFTH